MLRAVRRVGPLTLPCSAALHVASATCATHAPVPYDRASHPQRSSLPVEENLVPSTGRGGYGDGQSLWVHAVVQVATKTLKTRHAEARSLDRRSRFHVRQRIRDEGVLSNLYPLTFVTSTHDANGEGHASDCEGTIDGVFVYELYVTRDYVASTTDTSQSQMAGTAPAQEGKRASKKSKTTSAIVTNASSDKDKKDDAINEAQRRVRSMPAWRAAARSLRRHLAVMPPMVALRYRVYSMRQIPEALLTVDAEFWDIGWTCCELRPLGKHRYADLPPDELQELVNKILPWCVSPAAAATSVSTAEVMAPGTSTVAPLALSREKLGKFVCTSHGIAAAGLRIFRGCLAQATFIDEAKADLASSTQTAGRPLAPPTHTPITTTPTLTSRALGDSAEGLLESSALPVDFAVHAFIRSFTYRNRHVQSYRVADASGTFLASLWGPMVSESTTSTHAASSATSGTLRVGALYRASGGVRVRDFADRGIRLVELDMNAVSPLPTSASPAQSSAFSEHRQPAPSPASQTHTFTIASAEEESASPHQGHLALKIDTKGTIASETSLWEEVREHFGTGPYSDDVQQRVTRALLGTPVVISYSLQQGMVRSIRFPNATSPRLGDLPQSISGDDARVVRGALSSRQMDPALAALLPRLDVRQPYAVLNDHRLLPLQVLHCCFDPKMRGWQDSAIAALSHMPAQRAEYLAEYRAALAPGLAAWGLHLQSQPWSTHHLSVLPVPQKVKPSAALTDRRSPLRHPPPPAYPSTLIVMGIVPAQCTADERQRILTNTQHIARYFRTNLVACLPGEKEAVQYMVEVLLVPAAAAAPRAQGFASAAPATHVLRDANAAALIVTLDKTSRATRWVMAECLSRGVLPLALAPVVNANRISVLCGGLRRQLNVKFTTDPLTGVDLRKEVPSLSHRRVLLVGVDACHTTSLSTASIVAILSTPERQHVLPTFWRHDARGRETQHVAHHFRGILADAAALYDGLDEVVVFQDGDVHSELNAVKEEIQACVPHCGFTFLCLHKRTNTRFMFNGTSSSGQHPQNLVKGVVIQALTPTSGVDDAVAPSFYLQTHESNMSTARTVQYTVHHCSPTLDMSEVQQMANAMASVLAPQATKLPMCTRLAHRLSDHAERLLDAVPQMRADLIPSPLNQRLWYL